MQARVCESSANPSRHRHLHQVTRYELACLSTHAHLPKQRSLSSLAGIRYYLSRQASLRIFPLAATRLRGRAGTRVWTEEQMDSYHHRHHCPSTTSSRRPSRRRQKTCQIKYLPVLLVLITLLAFASAFLPQSPSRRLPLPLARRPSRSPHATNGGVNDGPTYFEWLGRQVELKLRPKPYQGLRLKIDKELAVLLMRSSYEIADELDFVAMNDFQKDFFTFRQVRDGQGEGGKDEKNERDRGTNSCGCEVSAQSIRCSLFVPCPDKSLV